MAGGFPNLMMIGLTQSSFGTNFVHFLGNSAEGKLGEAGNAIGNEDFVPDCGPIAHPEPVPGSEHLYPETFMCIVDA